MNSKATIIIFLMLSFIAAGFGGLFVGLASRVEIESQVIGFSIAGGVCVTLAIVFAFMCIHTMYKIDNQNSTEDRDE